MAGVATLSRVLRFGTFEVDLRCGELRSQGSKVHLQPQPFQILAILLEHPGELVTREEIRQRLWSSDTFVDFEHSLNTSIKKLREALGEEAGVPRYIETLPRRGYRFIGHVEPVETSSATPRTETSQGSTEVEVGAGLVPVQRNDVQGLEADAHPEGERGRAERRSAPATIATERHPQEPALNAVKGVPLRRILTVVAGVAVVLLAAYLAHLFYSRGRPQTVPVAIRSLAVLPLENLSGDKEQEYFADGLTDALITDLGKVVTLHVISRTSVMRYKGTKKPLPEIARELNVDAVVEGTVRRSTGRVRITAQLLDARTDRHLWAETYERDSEDVMQLEKQVALAIAREVSGRLTTAEETRLARGRTTNPRAYDAYLQGRYLWNERTAETEQGARAYFEQAVREDPSFALAYSGLADYCAVSWHNRTCDVSRAEEYARKAIALEPSLAEGHASLGIALVYQGKFAEGETELKRAIDLDPNYAMAHHWNALRLFVLGRLSEALAESDQARQLDPFSLPINYLRGGMLAGLHQYDRAREQFETAVAINPEAPEPHQQLSWIYWVQGRVPEGLAEDRRAAVLSGNVAVLHDQEEIAAVYAKSGLRAALFKAAHLKEKAYCGHQPGTANQDLGCYPALEIADHYAFLKDREKVLYWLDQAVRDRNIGFGLKSAPELDFVRSDPRFQDLLRRAGLPP